MLKVNEVTLNLSAHVNLDDAKRAVTSQANEEGTQPTVKIQVNEFALLLLLFNVLRCPYHIGVSHNTLVSKMSPM